MKKKLWIGFLAAMMMVALVGCSLVPGMSGGKDKEYHVGDEVKTRWFNYTVNSAEAMDSYEGYTAAEGNQLIVIDLTMKNTFTESVPMYYADFQLYWDEYQEEDDYCFALENFTDKQLPDEYSLAVDSSKSGTLVYEVPNTQKDFQFMFLEIMDDGSEEGQDGNLFAVYFTAE